MEAKDSFTLEWCSKHHNWWVTNCPDCMVDDNEESIKQAGIREVIEWLERTFAKTITIDQMMATNTWQEKMKKLGIE